MKENKYTLDIRPHAKAEAVVCGKKYRFTVLTDCLIRMEYQEDGHFLDDATQKVICRDFAVPVFQVIDGRERLEIITKELHLYYDKREFSPEGLYIYLKKGYSVSDSMWCYGSKTADLGGTARTLDNADGAIPLDSGIMSRDGYAVMEDSDSAVLTESGEVKPRSEAETDLYFFGYGHDYERCLVDFYRLSGFPPLLPKYTLGNWWSRFYSYSEESYLKLMEEFEQHGIPFSVCVIDMDWHLTAVDKKYGTGWTGYTWNRELFPDPERFLQKLHEQGKHVTLNLHPADGVRAFEEAYLPMAKELGVDYEKKEKIPFDVTNSQFMQAYFKYLHHPLEKQGVDFWWIDWQQGRQSRVKGIDPLWLLNHLHFMDSGRDGRLPLTFSRYAGLGSHRYPIGFSGDSISSWASLKFQPYFTANATNAGYTWWSHDIGGHQKGSKDDELITRWIQFGVFSPIMRLHSTANAFYGKEPWNYGAEAEKVITEFLRLRHKLLPWLYSLNYQTHFAGSPLIRPMYYREDVPEAYEARDQYYFGNLIVCPVTDKRNEKSLLAEADVWLPEGLYYDFFTGNKYRGRQKLAMYRGLESIPVLVPAGSILPMAADGWERADQNPEVLDIVVYAGADGAFSMYEDDGSNRTDMEPVITQFTFQEEKASEDGTEYVFGMKLEFPQAESAERAESTEVFQGIIPANRQYRIRLKGAGELRSASTTAKGVHAVSQCTTETGETILTVSGEEIMQFKLYIKCDNTLNALPKKLKAICTILRQAQIEYDLKEKVYNIIRSETEIVRIVEQLHEIRLERSIFGAILECLSSEY